MFRVSPLLILIVINLLAGLLDLESRSRPSSHYCRIMTALSPMTFISCWSEPLSQRHHPRHADHRHLCRTPHPHNR